LSTLSKSRWVLFGVVFLCKVLGLGAELKKIQNSMATPKEVAAPISWGKDYETLKLQFHSVRKLPNKKLLIVSTGTTASAPLTALFFDPVAETTSRPIPYPTTLEPNFEGVVGFKINDQILGFTNLSQTPYGNVYGSVTNRIVFWNATKNSWAAEAIEFDSKSQAALPIIRHRKGTDEIVFFKGEGVDTLGKSIKIPGIQINVTGRVVLADGRIEESNSLGHLVRARVNFDTSTFADGRIFIVGGNELSYSGGENGDYRDLVTAKTAEFYSPEKNIWYETPPLPSEITSAKAYNLNEKEVLVVNVISGVGFIWSFATKSWTSAFDLKKEVSRGLMLSNGKFIATVAGEKSGSEKMLIWNPTTKQIDYKESPLNFNKGTNLIEMEDQKVLETQPSGAIIWNFKDDSSKLLTKTK
jgi:hypothetical protein